MKPALIAKKPRYPRSWQELPNGAELKQVIQSQLDEVSRQMFGYHLVKVGDLSCDIDLPHCPIRHIVNISDAPEKQTGVIAKSDDLPLLDNSVDAVILANELDFAQDPHQVLREVNRVIMPNGYVVISGFNPFSVTGLLKYLPVNRKQILHDARFFSSMRMKDWLNLLGFEVQEQHSVIYSELFFERRMNPNSRWQRMCRKYLPGLSAMYILVAKKRVLPISVVKPQWKPKPNFSAVGASMRIVKKVS